MYLKLKILPNKINNKKFHFFYKIIDFHIKPGSTPAYATNMEEKNNKLMNLAPSSNENTYKNPATYAKHAEFSVIFSITLILKPSPLYKMCRI